MKLLVFDSHPVQYRVPIWRALERLRPGVLHVNYGTDTSVRGQYDPGFGHPVTWDEPLLDGYSNTILHCERGVPLSGWRSLTGAGVSRAIAVARPQAVLLNGLNYRFDLAALAEARRRGLKIWLRCETQDAAFVRGGFKTAARWLAYRLVYLWIHRAFYVGEFNRRHYLRHGLSPNRLRAARYGTVDRFAGMSLARKRELRAAARARANIGSDEVVVGFSGKLIPKKNPEVLLEMLSSLSEELRRRMTVYYLGSGELENKLREQAADTERRLGTKAHFAGFANQSELPGHYLAMDVLVLPSRRMGETWGLVANEAMQAGCGVVVSDAVGCSADFRTWERFRVYQEGRTADLAAAVAELVAMDRSYSWADLGLRDYSMEASAQALACELDELSTSYRGVGSNG